MDGGRRKTYEELYNRAIKVAKARGYSEIAEDFAGDLVVRWLEGKSQHQAIQYSLIEYLRREYGGTGRRCGSDAILRNKRFTSASSSENDNGDFNPEEQLERLYARSSYAETTATESSEHRKSDNLFGETLDREDWELINMYTIDELTCKQIGEIKGVSESRISQKLTKIKTKIRSENAFVQMRDLKERVEDDPEFTKVEVSWITL